MRQTYTSNRLPTFPDFPFAAKKNPQTSIFNYESLEQRVPKGHPLRALQALVDGILANLNSLFDERYSHYGRPRSQPSSCCALTLYLFYTSATGALSASRRILTICSSEYRLLRMTSPLLLEAILLSFKWSEKSRAGQGPSSWR